MNLLQRFLVFLISSLAVTGLAFADLEGWQTDLTKAIEQAKKEKKCVLVEFTGSDWCPPCIKMRKEVFSKKEFVEKASKNFILVELDFPNKDKALKEKNEPFAKKYKIEGFPSIVLLDSEGKEFTRFFATEHPGIDKFIAHLDRAIERKDLD